MQAEVERFARRASPLQAWDARGKVVSLAVLTLVLASLDGLPAATLGAVGALGLLVCGRLPLRFLARRLVAAQAFLLPCLLVLPLTFTAEPLWIGRLRLSGEGLRVAALFYLRALALVAVAMALVYSTPMLNLLRALQELRLPRIVVALALLTHRYLSTLAGEFSRMRWALATRGFSPRPRPAAWRPLANVVGVALVRSLERTERLQHATRSRGFTGQIHALQRFPGGPANWLKSAACLGAAAGLWLLDRGPGT
ncbi:MAG: cobalt ECF transporter T component CbiQ [Verrucomicrobia bacterium]|nr:cobalt ECF transporter T component CbiQ [Verrucomicrobiota bacterium]